MPLTLLPRLAPPAQPSPDWTSRLHGLNERYAHIIETSYRNPEQAVRQLEQELERPDWHIPLGQLVVDRYPEQTNRLRTLYAKHVLSVEDAQQTKPQAAQSLQYQKAATEAALLEAHAAGMTRESRVLFVGSGAMPLTVATYAQLAGKVVGIDCSPTAIAEGQRYLNQLNQPVSAGQVELKEGFGELQDYSPYSHVAIAVMVPDKAAVLRQINQTAKPGTVIILRTTQGLQSAFFPPCNADELKGFKWVGQLSCGKNDSVHTLLLQKTGLTLMA